MSAAAGVIVAGVLAAVIVVAGSHKDASAGQPGGPPPGAASSGAASSGPATGGSVPAGYLGHWQGTLQDHTGLEGPQDASINITGGRVGSIVGTASYPNVGCTYNFRLDGVTASQVTIYEEITGGLCQSEYVVLSLSGRGLADAVYATAPGQGLASFTGQLAKSLTSGR